MSRLPMANVLAHELAHMIGAPQPLYTLGQREPRMIPQYLPPARQIADSLEMYLDPLTLEDVRRWGQNDPFASPHVVAWYPADAGEIAFLDLLEVLLEEAYRGTSPFKLFERPFTQLFGVQVMGPAIMSRSAIERCDFS